MTPPALWIVAGLVIAALEMLAPGVFLLWIGLAALGTGAIAQLADLGWHAQLLTFVALTAILVAAAATRLRRRVPDAVNAPTSGLIGQTCRAIAFQNGEGRVTLGDGAWPARIADASQPTAGQPLRVTGLDGTTLLVTAHT